MGTLVLDSSAILAVLMHEPEAEQISSLLGNADQLLLTSVNYMETGIVWDNQPARKTEQAHLDMLIMASDIKVITTDLPLAQAARAAYRRFGKGRHPAKLNMGDCFAYALAKQMGAPLLYKGNDFAKTDVLSAI